MYSRLKIVAYDILNNNDLKSRSFSTHKPQSKWEDYYIKKESLNKALSDVKEGFAKQSVRDMSGHRVSVASIGDQKVVLGNNTTTKEETRVFVDNEGHSIKVKNESLDYNYENNNIKQHQHTATEVVMSEVRFKQINPIKANTDVVDTGTVDNNGIMVKSGKDVATLFTQSECLISHELKDTGEVFTTLHFIDKTNNNDSNI